MSYDSVSGVALAGISCSGYMPLFFDSGEVKIRNPQRVERKQRECKGCGAPYTTPTLETRCSYCGRGI